jgi:hypothetical protein
MVDLIRLDEKGFPESAQRVYLLYYGFVTGRKVPPFRIAVKMGLPSKQVLKVLENTHQSLSR